MLIAYVLYNSTERISLSLKSLAKTKYGDWDSDIDVKDALNQDIEKLSYYNAIDVSATYYLYNTLYPQLDEGQQSFYEKIVKDVQNIFIVLMSTGMPIDVEGVLKAEKELKGVVAELEETFFNNEYVIQATEYIIQDMVDKYNDSHKVKQVTPEFYQDIKFNVNSVNQLRVLLFDVMELPVLSYTKTKAPATDRASIKKWLETIGDESKQEVLKALIGFSETNIILNTFVTVFKKEAIEVAPGVHRLYGNLRTGGTISFRPTANNPNLLDDYYSSHRAS